MSNENDVRLVGNYTIELNQQGPPGAPGLGIASISETGYDIETGEYSYRITYTDGSYYDFVIQGGARYTGSTGITINDNIISVDTDVIATKSDLLNKQNVIDSSNKLSSDLVDDTGNTNKFATQSQLDQITTNQSDISTINSKISDSASSSNKLIDKNYVDTEDGDLQDQINNLKARGRFLALWNCATGLAETNPPQSPYVYHTGDYFIVGTVSSATPQVNYKPSGSSYTTGVASSAVETNVVDIDDVYYYDGTSWHLQVNTQKTVSFVNIAGSPYDNTNLATSLNSKQDTSTAVTHTASTAVGSSTNPVYITSDGTATATTYTLGKSVPNDAIFTDTTYTFSTGLTESSGTVTVNDYNKLVKNTADGTYAIGIGGSGQNSGYGAVAIGHQAQIGTADSSICIGKSSQTSSNNSIAIGTEAKTSGFTAYAYQIGKGTNSTAKTLAVGFGKDGNNNDLEYQLLDGATGKIPTDRIDTDSSPVNASTKPITSGGVYTSLSNKQDSSTAVTHTASTAVGSATKGVYVASDGTATAMTYSLNKDVPSNAVFTDTTYSVFTGADGTNAGTSGLVKAPTATDNTKFLKGDGTWATPAGSSYTFSTGLTESGGTVSVTDYNELIKNTAIEADSLSILGTQSYGNAGTINIGYNSEGSAVNGVAIGTSSKTMTNATAIGYGAKVLGTVQNPAFSGIQLGYGTNNDENTMYVGFLNANQANYKLLDGTTGKIPNARLDMDTTPTSASTKPITSGGVYTVLGDIETLLAAV